MKITDTNYLLKNLRETASSAFSATIFLNGEEVGYVENDGNGGCNTYAFENGMVGRDALVAAAKAVFPEHTFEVEDHFISKLANLAALSRKRNVVFVLPGDPDPALTGKYRKVSGNRAGGLDFLAAQFPEALVLDGSRQVFVPLAEAV